MPRKRREQKESNSSRTKEATSSAETKLSICDLNGKILEERELDSAVWGGRVNLGLLAQVLSVYRTNQRLWNASTKKRSQVSGGGRKPWRQKHTGRARVGSSRSPLWRHGGVVFGPKRCKVRRQIPQAMRRKALLESLKGKLRDGELVVVDRIESERAKTKPFGKLAGTFDVARGSIIVLDKPSDAIIKSLRNLAAFELRCASNLNALDVLNSQKVLMTKEAFNRMGERMGFGNGRQHQSKPLQGSD